MPIRLCVSLTSLILFAACSSSGGGGGSSNDDGGDDGGSNPPPPTNTLPVAQSASYDTSDIGSIDGALQASDDDGDALTYQIASQPQRGTLTSFDAATGEFTYTVSDAEGASAPATISVEIFGWRGSQQFGTFAEDIALTGGLIITDDGGLVFGGYSEESIDGMGFGGESDAWVRKLTRRGEIEWTYVSRDTEASASRNVLAHPSGEGFYVTMPKSPDVDSGRDEADVVRLSSDGV